MTRFYLSISPPLSDDIKIRARLERKTKAALIRELLTVGLEIDEKNKFSRKEVSH